MASASRPHGRQRRPARQQHPSPASRLRRQLQSRAFAGQIGDTFIFCLPGSTGACRDGWDLVLRDELDSRYRPCSLAGLVPRLRDLVAS